MFEERNNDTKKKGIIEKVRKGSDFSEPFCYIKKGSNSKSCLPLAYDLLNVKIILPKDRGDNALLLGDKEILQYSIYEQNLVVDILTQSPPRIVLIGN